MLQLIPQGGGFLIPLLLHRVAHHPNVAAQVGRLTVANTIGTIFGSILAGYVILPAIGSEGALRVVAVALAALAIAFARGPSRRGRRGRPGRG